MSYQRYTPEFKDEAAREVTEKSNSSRLLLANSSIF